MAKKKGFGEGAVHTAANYIWWLFLGNFYFLLTNILFILVWMGTNPESAFNFNIVTIISLLPAGPAFAALFSVMGKLIREKDVDMTKDFFRAYRKNFLEALFYWTVFVIILSVAYIDVSYFNASGEASVFKYSLIVITFLVVSMMLYILPVISRFYFKKRDVFRISFYYTFKKMRVTLLNWILLAGLTYMLIKVLSLLVLFFWSAFCYLIMYNEKPVLEEIEEKHVSS